MQDDSHSLRLRFNESTIEPQRLNREKPRTATRSQSTNAVNSSSSPRAHLERSQTYHDVSSRMDQVSPLANRRAGMYMTSEPTTPSSSMPSQDIEKMQRKYSLYRDAFKSVKRELELVSSDAAAMEEELKSSQKSLRALQPVRAEVCKLQDELVHQMEGSERLRSELVDLRQLNTTLHSGFEALRSQQNARDADLHALLIARDELQEQTAAMRQQLDQTAADRDQMRQRIAEWQEQEAQWQAERGQLQTSLHDAQRAAEQPASSPAPTQSISVSDPPSPIPRSLEVQPAVAGLVPSNASGEGLGDSAVLTELQQALRTALDDKESLARQLEMQQEASLSDSHEAGASALDVSRSERDGLQQETNRLNGEVEAARRHMAVVQEQLEQVRAEVEAAKDERSPAASSPAEYRRTSPALSIPFENTSAHQSYQDPIAEIKRLRFSLAQAKHQVHDLNLAMRDQQSRAERLILSAQSEVAEAQMHAKRLEAQARNESQARETELRYRVEKADQTAQMYRRQLESTKSELSFQSMQAKAVETTLRQSAATVVHQKQVLAKLAAEAQNDAVNVGPASTVEEAPAPAPKTAPGSKAVHAKAAQLSHLVTSLSQRLEAHLARGSQKQSLPHLSSMLQSVAGRLGCQLGAVERIIQVARAARPGESASVKSTRTRRTSRNS